MVPEHSFLYAGDISDRLMLWQAEFNKNKQ